jgi:hypothetical protein
VWCSWLFCIIASSLHWVFGELLSVKRQTMFHQKGCCLLLLLLLLQVDHLSRQLSRGAADGEEVAAQREGLLGELAAAQQVRGQGQGWTEAVTGWLLGETWQWQWQWREALQNTCCCCCCCWFASCCSALTSVLFCAAVCVRCQVRLMLERGREELQRQLAAADAQLGLMQGKLGDAQAEIEGLTTRLQLEQGR